jgi:hypothetical protein
VTVAPEAKRSEVTTAQLRTLSATLRRVEKGLDRIERLLAESASGATYRWRENVSPTDRGAIRHLCRRVRAALDTACGSLQVEAEERSLPREIREEVTALCAVLRNTESTLTAYGPLAPEERGLVHRRLGDIESGLVHLLHLVGAHASPDRAQERAPIR